MPIQQKIPPMLHGFVLAKSEEGLHSEQIATLLWSEHKLEVSSRSIRNLVSRHRAEMADAAKSVVRDEIRKRLIPALRRAARGGIRAHQIERRLCKEARIARKEKRESDAADLDMLALKAIDRQVTVANLLLHYAGVDQPDQPGSGKTSQEKRAALLRRLEELTRPKLTNGATHNGEEPKPN